MFSVGFFSIRRDTKIGDSASLTTLKLLQRFTSLKLCDAFQLRNVYVHLQVDGSGDTCNQYNLHHTSHMKIHKQHSVCHKQHYVNFSTLQ